MDYETLRHFADSWALLVLFAIFLFVVVFIFRRGSSERYRDAASIPLKDSRPDERSEP